jgi:signal transduction histidine kinase
VAEQVSERIGHDLHDDLCQHLIAIEFQNQALIKEWGALAPAAATKAGEISALLRQTIEHARDLARGLSPNLFFEPDSLVPALQELAQRTERIYRIPCHFECPAPVRIADEATSIHLYRIAQEAVSNAIKHAKAGRIDLRLVAQNGAIVLGVQDNGIGLKNQQPRKNGVGLKIMQYRAGAIGGSLAIQHLPGGGTAIVCTVKGQALPRPPAQTA